MKRLFIIIGLCLLVTSAGCKADDAQAAVPEAEAERVTVMGEITLTVGNMVTLNIIERPAMEEIPEGERNFNTEELPEGERPQGRRGFNMEELTDEERAAFQERSGEGFNPQEMPEGSFRVINPEELSGEERAQMQERFTEGGGRFNMEELSEEERAAMQERFGNMGRSYTGESKEIIIPAGAPIMEITYKDGQAEEVEITQDKLKAGDIIEATYAADGETVAKVVKQAAGGRARQGGFIEGGAFPEGVEGFQITVPADGAQAVPGVSITQTLP